MGLDDVNRATDTELIRLAMALAGQAAATGDVPIGALVLAPDGVTIGEGWNAREATGDPTAHAEIVALRAAARALGDWNLTGCTMAVTVEPCTMCAGAITLARLDRVVFGCWEPKTGSPTASRSVAESWKTSALHSYRTFSPPSGLPDNTRRA
jgi:tRNA(adenine34) deaminase